MRRARGIPIFALSLLGCSGLLDSSDATYKSNASAASATLPEPAPPLSGGAMLGMALAAWDDELLVGAPGAMLTSIPSSDDRNCDEPIDANEAGRVFLYTTRDRRWHGEPHELERPRANHADGLAGHLGFPPKQVLSLARSGDVVAVGFPGMNHSACASGLDVERPVSKAGGVYLYERDGDGFAPIAFLPSPHPTNDGLFGGALALSGDRLFVGAPGEDAHDPDSGEPIARKAGAVYVFDRSGETWSQRARLTPANPVADASFGNALAIDGDTVAVGAFLDPHDGRGVNATPDESFDTQLSGAVYVLRERDGEYEPEAFIKAENAEANDAFGLSIALEGDVLAVGAPLEDSDAPSTTDEDEAAAVDDNSLEGAGAVYVYRRVGDEWSLVGFLKASEPQVGAAFGIALALRDGRLAIGAASEGRLDPINNPQHDDSGTVYLFDAQALANEPKVIRPKPDDIGGLYGFGLALGPDWLAIGGPGANGSTGDVHIVDLDD